MNQNVMRETKKKYFWLAGLTMAILLSSALFVPTLSAYADKPRHGDSPNTNNGGNNDDHHQKDRKDKDHDDKKCKHEKKHKYKKECDE